MLQPAVAAVGVGHGARQARVDQAGPGRHPEQRDVAAVLEQRRVVGRVGQHQVLDDELDVDHAAAIVLQVEELAAVGVAVVHLAAHRDDLLAQLREIAAPGEHVAADGLEALADRAIAGAEAGAGQRLVLPGPGRVALVGLEGRQRGDQQAGGAVGPQPQVDLEEQAGGGARRQPAGQALGEQRVGLGGALVVVVEQEDQVQVRGVAELLAAQPAIGDRGEARALAEAMAQLRPDDADRQVEHPVGQLAQVIRHLFDGEAALEILDHQPEHLGVVRLAHDVHLALDVGLVVEARRVDPLRELGRPGVVVGGLEQLAVEQLVEHHRVAHQVVGRPLRPVEDAQHSLEGFGELREQRHVGGPPADRLEQVDQADQPRVAAAQAHRVGQQPLDGLAGAGLGGRVARAGAQRVEAAGHFGIEFGGGLRALPGRLVRGARGRREQAVEDGFHRVGGLGDRGIELGRRHPQHRRHVGAHRRIVGQAVGLRVVAVLQRVLGPAQQPVGPVQRGRLVGRQQAALGQRGQRDQGAAVAQTGVAAAANHLEELGGELDLADPAAAQLHVGGLGVAGRALGDFLADQPVQVAQRGEGLVVHVAPEHEGIDDPLERLLVGGPGLGAGHAGVGDHPALEPGEALPLATLRVEIGLEHAEGNHQRAGIAVRAKAGVHPEHEAVCGELGERGDRAPSQPVHPLAGGDAARALDALGLALGAKDEDQVEVGGHVQLVAAGLAHSDREQVLGPALAVQRPAVPGEQRGRRVAHRVAGRHAGEGGHRTADLVEAGGAAHVALDQAEHQPLPRPAQGGLDRQGRACQLGRQQAVDRGRVERRADQGLEAVRGGLLAEPRAQRDQRAPEVAGEAFRFESHDRPQFPCVGSAGDAGSGRLC